MNEYYQDSIPAHFMKEGRVLWYKVVLHNGETYVARPLENGNITDRWSIRNRPSVVISDRDILKWKMISI